jgi:hypothetical protein
VPRRDSSLTTGRHTLGEVRRWVLVSAVIAALVAVPVVRANLPVSAPRVDPAELRDRILASAGVPYQGYADTQGSVILPALPQLSEVTQLFGGGTSMRVWRAAAGSWRVAVLDPVGERDTYRGGGSTYTWDFGRNLWTQVVGDLPARLPQASDLLPPDLARRLLAEPSPGDRLTALPARRVAGIAAVGLRFTPGDPDTTIGWVDVWADPTTGLPLQVQLAGVFTSRFLDLSLTAPDPHVLIPDAAASSGVTTTTQNDVTAALNIVTNTQLPAGLAGRPRLPGQVGGLGVYGTGLSRFVVAPLPGRVGQRTLDAVRNAGGTAIPGGFSVRSAVLTVLVVRPARRTYVLAGFASPELLARAASELR